MRNTTMVGLALAGAAVAAAAVTGVAYAADDAGPVEVRIVQEEQGGGSYDCPEKEGSPAAGESEGAL
jgi:hypothetical protein